MKLSTSAFCIVFIAMVAFLALPTATDALAQTSTCDFDSASQTFQWSISGGDAVWYFAHGQGEGCIDTNEVLDSLMGPSGSSSFSMICAPGEGKGCGTVSVPVCEGENCFDIHNFNFRCIADCHLIETDDCLPTITEWGMLVLLTLLVITGVYLIRRKRATAVR